MTEMIEAYLKQTPPLVSTMVSSYKNKDWKLLKASVHKMIPSFSIVGINPQFTDLAKKIQDYADQLELSVELNELILQLEKVVIQSITELEYELALLNPKAS